MEYTTYQIIILLDDALHINRKENIVEELKDYIRQTTKKIDIRYQESKKLAYKIDKHEKAWFVAIQIKLKAIGSNKRIREIKEKLNTYKEILDFKILQENNKEENLNYIENKIYLVYEFDYGNNFEGIEPNVTLFDAYNTREEAVKKANELLEEGLEKYYMDSCLADNKNPFKDNNEVHLYEQEEEQEGSVYYIKIERINLK